MAPTTALTSPNLLDGGDAPLVVLVPANTERHLLVDFLENLSMLEIAKAFRELTAQPRTLTRSVPRPPRPCPPPSRPWPDSGGGVTGEVVDGGAVDGLVAKVKELDAAQAVVITRPHAMADTFHTDWANKAQDQLGLPVLHLYAGSGFIGDS